MHGSGGAPTGAKELKVAVVPGILVVRSATFTKWILQGEQFGAGSLPGATKSAPTATAQAGRRQLVRMFLFCWFMIFLLKCRGFSLWSLFFSVQLIDLNRATRG